MRMPRRTFPPFGRTLVAALAAVVVAASPAAAGLSPPPVVTPAQPAFPTMPSYVPAALDALPSGRTTLTYRTLADYLGEMQALADENPGLVRTIDLPHVTMEGRTVAGLEITHDVGAASDGKPVFFMMGAIHGNEWPAAEHSIEFAHDLVELAATDPVIGSLLDRVRVAIVPIVNVDGFVHNRRQSCRRLIGGVWLADSPPPTCDTASNAQRPVDLNRNYPFGWGGTGATTTGRGPGPGSEPENRNVMDYLTSHQVTVLATNHTSGHVLLWPPLELRAGATPDEDIYVPLADAMAAQNGYNPLWSARDAQTTGETIDWSYYATRALSFTFEIVTGGSAPTYQRLVDDYLGIGQFAGHPNRNAFFLALEYAANPEGHAVIEGKGPKDAIVRITKDFSLWSAPPTLGGGMFGLPIEIPTHLESAITLPTNGKFVWHVDPSVRPAPAYGPTGVAFVGGFLQESWTLTCSRPDGTVLETQQVTVDRGQHAEVLLKECKEYFHKKAIP